MAAKKKPMRRAAEEKTDKRDSKREDMREMRAMPKNKSKMQRKMKGY